MYMAFIGKYCWRWKGYGLLNPFWKFM